MENLEHNMGKISAFAAKAGDKAHEFSNSVKRAPKDYIYGTLELVAVCALGFGAWVYSGKAWGNFTKRRRRLDRIKKKRARESQLRRSR